MARKKKRSWDDILQISKKSKTIPYFSSIRLATATHTIECLGDSVHRIKKTYYSDGTAEVVEHIAGICINIKHMPATRKIERKPAVVDGVSLDGPVLLKNQPTEPTAQIEPLEEHMQEELEQNSNLDRLEKLYEEANQTPLIYERMCAVMADMDAIIKTRDPNSGVKYAFRSIEDVMNTIHPILVKHQVFIVPTRVDTEHSQFDREKKGQGNATYTQMNFRSIVRQTFMFYTIDGSGIQAEVAAESIDQSDKATQQASSYCFKNVILQSFCVPTKDLQGDGDDKQPDTTSEKAAPKSRLADAPKLADLPKRIEAMTEEDWKVVKSWFKPFIPLGFNADAFHTWSVKTLREKGLNVPEHMKDLPRESGLYLNKVAQYCNTIGGVVHNLTDDKDAGDFQILESMPETSVASTESSFEAPAE